MFGNPKKTAPTAPQQEAAATEATANYPLLFSNPHVITLDRHAQAKLRSDITLEFARDTNSVPLTLTDIPEASKYYPLAFSMSDPIIPVAIVGLEQNNYFVDAQGKWEKGCYVPSYVRKYPFVFMEMPGSDQLTLCVDEVALTYDLETEGTRLYEDGHPSAFTNNALEFCAAYQEQHRLTLEFCEILKQKEMLSPQRSDVEMASGKMIQLNGFQLIDPEKFKALSEAEVYDWFKRGFLAMTYHMMQSHSNWRNLLEMANKNETDAKIKNK